MLDYMERKQFSGEDSGNLSVRIHAAANRGGAVELSNALDFARRPVGDSPSAHINLQGVMDKLTAIQMKQANTCKSRDVQSRVETFLTLGDFSSRAE